MLAEVMTLENFHPYLYGKRFEIFTDHLPITWIWTKKNPHPRIERWMMRMALYEFIVIYKPGKENLLADFLSRINEDNLELDPDEQNDYHDQLVALTEVSTEKEINECIEEIAED
jgi:hypothetical protein